MNAKLFFFPETRFGGYPDVDGTVAFYTRLRALTRPEHAVLDVGCGRGKQFEDQAPARRELRNLKGSVARVIGIDVDEASVVNPGLDEFHLLTNLRWPLADRSVDLIVCDYVLEHVADPAAFFSEARRVLRPRGHLCIRTANVWNYVCWIARIIPNKFHAAVVGYA